MSNVPYKFKRGNEEGLNTLPIEDGSIIVTKDTHQLFVDFGDTRHSITPESATDEDIVAMFNTNDKSVFSGSDNPEVSDF